MKPYRDLIAIFTVTCALTFLVGTFALAGPPAQRSLELMPATSTGGLGTGGGGGVIIPPGTAFCAADGSAGDLHVDDDLEVGGMQIWFCGSSLIVSADTADGADTGTFGASGGGGGSAATSRGARISLLGNEHATFPGSFRLDSGDVAGADGTMYIQDDFTLTVEDGATDNTFLQSQTGFAFTGNAGDDVSLGGGINLRLNGSTSGTLDFATPASTTSYTLTAPANDGSTGQVLYNTDGAGTLGWAARPTSVLLSSGTGFFTCTACPASLQEIGADQETRTRFDSSGYASIRAVVNLTAAAVTADVFIQCDTDSAFGSPTDATSVLNPAVRSNYGSWDTLAGECVGADVYWRAATKNGDTAEAPSFNKVEVQFK